jgi:hypothetical protein
MNVQKSKYCVHNVYMKQMNVRMHVHQPQYCAHNVYMKGKNVLYVNIIGMHAYIMCTFNYIHVYIIRTWTQ